MNAEVQAIEAAAIRRRWITLGEILAVVAVLISGLTLWNSWSERSASEIHKSDEARHVATRAATLILLVKSSAADGLILQPSFGDQSIQSQTISFPSALEIAAAHTIGEPRIEAAWFEKPLKSVRNLASLPDESRGDEQFPVAISTRFLVNGEAHEDIALYDIGYTVSRKWLTGHTLSLQGISLISHLKGNQAQSKLDARWAALFPSK